MKTRKSDVLTVILFCGFLAVMMLCYLILPKETFSENEKRYLEEAPDLNWNDVASGSWGNEAETYMADHIPGRDFFVGLNAYFELYTGRQVAKDIWIQGDRLVEAPVENDAAAIQKNMSILNTFSQSIEQNVDLMIIPSSGWASGAEEYSDSKIIADIYALAGENITTWDMLSVYENNPGFYYKTDHHWNSEGAYAAYQTYMIGLNREYRSAADFTKTIPARFQGSTYSRSALWLTPAEDLALWLGSDDLTVVNGESEEIHDGVFYRERLEEADKYTVFLDGNHSIVRIQNPNAEGRLLVIRDSYSNSLGCFLAESYAEVVLVDLRYYKQPVSALAAEEGFDNILVCYSIGNFLTDTNLPWLR